MLVLVLRLGPTGGCSSLANTKINASKAAGRSTRDEESAKSATILPRGLGPPRRNNVRRTTVPKIRLVVGAKRTGPCHNAMGTDELHAIDLDFSRCHPHHTTPTTSRRMSGSFTPPTATFTTCQYTFSGSSDMDLRMSARSTVSNSPRRSSIPSLADAWRSLPSSPDHGMDWDPSTPSDRWILGLGGAASRSDNDDDDGLNSAPSPWAQVLFTAKSRLITEEDKMDDASRAMAAAHTLLSLGRDSWANMRPSPEVQEHGSSISHLEAAAVLGEIRHRPIVTPSGSWPGFELESRTRRGGGGGGGGRTTSGSDHSEEEKGDDVFGSATRQATSYGGWMHWNAGVFRREEAESSASSY
ncbi:unnamed protein product [Zymoseptoria tritici ST99CH_1A5]|uniref:Uncharacterized protein n=1 Tax=Zymoseptoria tritici ST99CH_1A5 TaxID=1276529 RepID=A0A1Y6M3X2_ZYMTR|nr:unnamed protein product [Zymoseptoria tritici ST99CH_1A5]